MVHSILSAGMKVGDCQRKMIAFLTPLYGEGEAKAMTRLIFHNLKGWSVTDLVINADQPVSQYIADKINNIVAQLNTGMPLQYILGEARFYGMDLKVSPAVLIPRQETEELVDLIVTQNKSNDLNVLDICTGSGAIAIALARNLPFSKVEALDISEDALKIAQINAEDKHAGIKFDCADIFKWNPQSDFYDIIVSNPPYIAEKEKVDMDKNVLDFEPHIALFVPDDDPLRFYKRIAEVASVGLKRGGKLYLEINPLYADRLKTLLESKFKDVVIIKDISGRNRFAECVND